MSDEIRLERPWFPLTEEQKRNGVKYSERDWELMRLPRIARKATVKGIPLKKLRDFILHYLKNLRDIRFDGTGILLTGPNGVGKTMALSIVLRAFYAHGQTAIYTTAYEVLRSTISSIRYTSDYELFEYAKKCDVLFIDEVGSEHKSNSAFDSTTFEHLVRTRYAENRITLFATNYTHKVWREHYRESLWSVVENTCYPFKVGGEDQRKIKSKSITKDYK